MKVCPNCKYKVESEIICEYCGWNLVKNEHYLDGDD